jgi:hypothetical protein
MVERSAKRRSERLSKERLHLRFSLQFLFLVMGGAYEKNAECIAYLLA